MLAKCVNPVCSAQFRFLHQGKLFEVEIHHRDNQSSNGQRALGNSKAHTERYWLCDQCTQEVDLHFDGRHGLVVRSRIGSGQALRPVFQESSGRTVTEVSRVMIRPLDLNLRVRRSFSGNSKMQARDAA